MTRYSHVYRHLMDLLGSHPALSSSEIKSLTRPRIASLPVLCSCQSPASLS